MWGGGLVFCNFTLLSLNSCCRSKDEEIDLVTLEEFYSEAPEEISKPVCIHLVVYINIDHTLGNSLHRLLNCEIGALDCHVITTQYRARVHCIHF